MGLYGLQIEPLGVVRPKGERVGEIAAKAAVQLLFSTQEFHGGRTALLFDADKRGLVVKLLDLKLVEEFSGADAVCVSRQLKLFCSASGSQPCRN